MTYQIALLNVQVHINKQLIEIKNKLNKHIKRKMNLNQQIKRKMKLNQQIKRKMITKRVKKNNGFNSR